MSIVLLPHERIPLHVFEPRYQELIGECVESGGEFGLILADQDGVRTVGTMARVLEVMQRFPDGRMNIVVEGRDRFRVVAATWHCLDGSPAIDAADDSVCAAPPVLGVDQRGVTRPQGPHCDIGSYEKQ